MSELRDPKGGLTAAGRKAFGGNLKPGVKDYDSASLADKKRWISWALRFYGQDTYPPLKKPNGEPTRFALTAAAWGEPVPETEAAARAIAAKARRRQVELQDSIEKRRRGRNYSIPSPLSTPKEIAGSHGHKPAGTSIRWPALYRHLRKKGYSKQKAAMISNGQWRKKHGLPPASARGAVGRIGKSIGPDGKSLNVPRPVAALRADVQDRLGKRRPCRWNPQPE